MQPLDLSRPSWGRYPESDYNHPNSSLIDFHRSSDLKTAAGGYEILTRHLFVPKTDSEDEADSDEKTKKCFEQGHFYEAIANGSEYFNSRYIVFDEAKRPNPDKDFRNSENQKWKKELLENAELLEKKLFLEKDARFAAVEFRSELENKFMSQMAAADQQVTAIWQESNGVKFRVRTDYTNRAGRVILDCKTTRHTTESDVKRDILKLRYPLQATMQIRGLQKTGYFPDGETITYLWAIKSTSYPYPFFIAEFTTESQAVELKKFFELSEWLREAKQSRKIIDKVETIKI